MSKLKMLLVKLDADYADEFNVRGFSIMTQEEYDNMILLAGKTLNVDGVITKCFGTNEELEWESLDDFKRDFEVTELTDEESKLLKKLFKSEGGGFGTTTPDRILDSLRDQ